MLARWAHANGLRVARTACWGHAAKRITFGRASGKLYLSVLSSSLDAGASLPRTLSPQAAACAITLGGIQLLNGGINPVNVCVHLRTCKASFSAFHARVMVSLSADIWCVGFQHRHSRTCARAKAYQMALEQRTACMRAGSQSS